VIVKETMMKKTGSFSVLAAGALALTSMFGAAAQADDWRESRRDSRYERRQDRDFIGGTVQRVDRRRGVVVLREARSGRTVLVEMNRRSRGIDIDDLRRGDHARFVGDWTRNGVFTAWRIEDVDSGRNRRDRRW
jgi:hypothetical protein